MAVAQGPFLAAVLLLVSSGLHCSSPLPACPEPCTCQRAPLLNCSSSSLSLVPQGIQDSVTDLDLSHNLLGSVTLDRPHYNLRNVWLGNNSITRLSLCIERNLGGRNDRGRHRLRPWSRLGCVSWAPTLQLLSVERNQLEQLPEGLEGSDSLQVLQLSFNKISTLRPGDLSHLQQLTELHLQHNLITSLHPQMFQDLAQLRVLDLSFNMLTSLHPLMYLSLRNIGADVRLSENRWQCDCSMRGLRRRMAFDSSRGLKPWSVVCASPSILSGRDLLQLEEDDLNCFNTDNRPELHQDVTVYRGSEILLSCSAQDSMWWTPSGQASVSQPQAGLLINDITERDTGLYVCVSEEHKVVSVFNLQISKIGGASRKTRSLPRTSQQIIPQDTPNRIGQERNQTTPATTTQSDLALAVCLSILFTFLIAFIIGVLARPCVDNLWKRVTKKKSSHETNSVPPVDQRQYDNEAYVNGDDPEEVITHRERRVTFSTEDFRESSYYDTVASNDQESINNDEYGARRSSEETQRDGRTHITEFEHIPDPVELENRRSTSSCSDSSLSSEGQTNQRDHTAPKSPQLAEGSVQQRADSLTARKVVVSQISREDSEIPGSSEPFADWSPHAKDLSLTGSDLWQESGEQFEFSDSVRSVSARSSSVGGSFKNSKPIVTLTSDTQRRDDMSSSSSFVSENEPTSYTVNPYPEEDIGRNPNKPEERYDTQRHAKRSSSSSSSDSDGKDNTVKQDTTTPSTKDMAGLPIKEYQPVSHIRAPSPPTDSSSSSDIDDEITHHTMKQEPGKVDLEPTTHVNRSQDTKAPSLASDSSSSSGSEVETTNQITSDAQRPRHSFSFSSSDSDEEDKQQPTLYLDRIPRTTKRVEIKAPSPSESSSSSNSEDEITHHTVKKELGKVDIAGLPFQESQRLIQKAPSPASDSSSSGDSEDETTNQINKQEQEEMYIKKAPIKVSQTVSQDLPDSDSSSSSGSEVETTNQIKRQVGPTSDAQRPRHSFSSSSSDSDEEDKQQPTLYLDRIPRTTKRVEIKAPSPSESSSSSDSEDETTNHIKKQDQGKTYMDRLPIKVQTNTQTSNPDPQTQWPALDLEHTTQIKKHIDIQAPAPDSSSSSNSEDETNHMKRQEQQETYMERLPIKVSQTSSPDPQTQWPLLDLEDTTRIKKHLDIKAPSQSSDSSSSSDSEDETAHHTKKERAESVGISKLPFRESQTVSHDSEKQWPAIDLGDITRIKKRLDIKVSTRPSDSSSSSDSEDETTGHIEKQKAGKVGIAVSQDPETGWSAVDLGNINRVKKRLDIKAPSQPSDSSSSSDSEDETNHMKKQEQLETCLERLPPKVSQTSSPDPQTQWPLLDLERTTHIKKRLDIKAPSQPSDSSSSSSDSEDETTHHAKKERPESVGISKFPFQESQTVSQDSEKQWPAVNLANVTRIKKRLDIKAPSQPSDSSSSSDSEDETTNQIKKQEQGETYMERLPPKVSQTSSPGPQTQWPLLDLERTTPIKKRLDIKAPSQPSDSSSNSSDSEDETTHHAKKERPELVGISKLPFQDSQTGSHDSEKQWPAVDLGDITRIKKRLDIKVPSQPSDSSSSSSDSEDETTNQIKKQEQWETCMERLPPKISETSSPNPQTQWPLLDLEHTTHIKRRLDIKAPSRPSDLSSSSDSEDETAHHTKKERPESVGISKLPFPESQTVSHDSEKQWPAIDLGDITRIKKRLDIKVSTQPSDSSSSSDSEDETTGHIEKQKAGKVGIAVSQDPETGWSAVDLGNINRVKKRLDIKAPSQPSDSSSSSDSEDETNHMKKQEQWETCLERLPPKVSQTSSPDPQTQWPLLDLEHTTHIKKRLDIKAPSQPSDSSSSSSDSEDETTHHAKKERAESVGISQLPFQESQTVSQDSEKQWPAVNLANVTRIKKRLDIKVSSRPSDSSSSSDSEDETTNQIKKQEQGGTWMERLPPKVSQTSSPGPQTQWPLLDLERTTPIKKRLDIKAPSRPSDSSSSSDSEDETTHHAKKERTELVGISKLPFQDSQTGSHDSEKQWPAIDLGDITRIKKRLDIKVSSQPSDSSSSSDSEDETTGHIEKQKAGMVGIAVSQDPETGWSAVDLGNINRVKKHLDIKAPSQPSDSSSSSDSEDETNHMKKQEQWETCLERLPPKVSQTSNPDPQTQWPLLDLGQTTRIKKRLDIKAPSRPSDSSSSSSDSEDETTHHAKKERPELVGISKLPFQDSQTGSQDSEKQWTAVNLANVTRIKKRIDIKVSSQPSDSSSSSDSEDETTNQIKKQEQGGTWMERLPPKVSQTSSPDPQTQWPLLDLEQTTRIKKRLDIKAQSPSSDSSSSSDSDNEITHHTKKERPELVGISKLPFQDSQTGSHDSEKQWPAVDLGDITRIKKRLDIKAPSQPSDSSSSSDSENETTNHTKKQEQGKMYMERLPIKVSQTVSPDPQTQWPALDLQQTTRIKKRLDIKAPSRPSDSSSSSDSEDETAHHTRKERAELVGISKLPFQESQAVSHDSEKQWPAVGAGDITRIKKRLDIKAPSRPSDSSSSSDSEDETTNKMEDLHNSPTTIKHTGFGTLISSSPKTDRNIKLEKYQVITDEMRDEKTSGNINTTPEINSELEARWATMNLGISRFRKRLTITPNKHEPPKLPSSPPPDSDLSGMTENDSLITYKRLIFKPSSPLSNSFSHSDPTDQANKRQTRTELVTVAQGPSHSVGDRNPSLAPTRVSSTTFDDVVKRRIKQSRHTINVDVPPEIRWTGIGRYLSDPSISSQRRHLDIGLSTSQQPSPAELELPTLPDSSNSSLSANNVSHAFSGAFDKFDNSPGRTNEILRAVSISEQKRERKGLSAIKAMSSERQQWDTEDASLLFVNDGPQGDTSFNYAKSEEDVKPLAKQPLTQLHTSSAYSTLDLLYGFPHYKSHDTPPAIPATPPPDEAVELTWGSLQSSKKQGLEGTGSYLQQSRNTQRSDPSSITSENLADYFDSSNISHV